jgi:hypothetical protein
MTPKDHGLAGGLRHRHAIYADIGINHRIRPRSARLLRPYRSTIAATNSSGVAMLTRLIIHRATN